jgi:hypothetical protein
MLYRAYLFFQFRGLRLDDGSKFVVGSIDDVWMDRS